MGVGKTNKYLFCMRLEALHLHTDALAAFLLHFLSNKLPQVAQ